MKFFIATHVFYPEPGIETYGPAYSVFEFLKKHKEKAYFIAHDINGKEESYVIDCNDEKVTTSIPPHNLVIRFISEIFFSIKSVISLSGKQPYLYIGVDPINGVAGGVLRYIFHCQKNIYFCVDYTDKRYKNFFLNQFYFFMDRFALFLADEAWSVSSRIIEVRAKQGVPKEKNKFLPNTPDTSLIKQVPYKGNTNLIIVSNLHDTLSIQPILQAIKQLSFKYSLLHLTIIGSGPKEQVLKNAVFRMKLTSHVSFMGQKSHQEVLTYIQNSFLGIAFYTPNGGNKYGDSMKVREYMACGIPVIMNDVPATADDVKVYESGFVLNKADPKLISAFIEKCIIDKKYYQKLRKNAFRLGKTFDKEKLLQLLLLPR